MTTDQGIRQYEQRPQGDSYGSLGETVVTPKFRSGPLRNLRERQLALVVLCVGALVIILDASVVNVALPSIRADLKFSQADLAWVVNAYLVPFGSLLLLGGRLGDLWGDKRVFMAGLSLFTVASVACGLAQNQEMLIGARFFQGVGGALASSVVLAAIVSMFPNPREQNRAVAVYAFVASSGAAIGLLAGALLTDAINWHWIFFINVPICIGTLLFGRTLLYDGGHEDEPPSLDITGSVLIVAALMLAIYTIVRTVDNGWTSGRTLGLAGGALALLCGFALRQRLARDPLLPPEVLRARNVAWTNIVLMLLAVGPTATFFLGALYLQQVQRFSVIEVGFAFLPVAVTVAVVTLKATPRLMRHIDPKTIMLVGLAVMAAGLALFGLIPVHGGYALYVLPGLVLVGLGTGLAAPATLAAAVAGATSSDSGVRSGLVNTTQQLGGALGLAVLATVATDHTKAALTSGEAPDAAQTSGYAFTFLIAAGIVLAGLLITAVLVKTAVPKTAPTDLDSTLRGLAKQEADLTGVKDADFVAFGLGGANMMAMLWSIAMGRRSVGVELRGDPFVAVMHWNIYEDLYHHLCEIDRLMIERYGEARIPRRADGALFRLADCFFQPDSDGAGDARTDEVFFGWVPDGFIAGLVRESEFIDDRWVDGEPRRRVQAYGPVPRPAGPDRGHIGRPMSQVLAERPAFLVPAEDLLILLRRYLNEVEKMDLAAGVEPRCRIYRFHRVVEPVKKRGRRSEPEGFSDAPDGRKRIRIEAIREMDGKRSYRRVRAPGTEIIDLGVPELFVLAEGLDGTDPAKLGFRQEPWMIDHHDGRGPIPAQADYLVGLMQIYVDSRIRKRITSEFDKDGNEYWVRQVAIGHEEDAEIGWVIAEVPDFRTFDPALAGMVPPGTPVDSKEYFAGYQYLLRDYWLDKVSVISEIPRADIDRTSIASTPLIFTVQAKIGVDARVARNGVVAGDAFGTGDFLSSGGVNTGMLGHADRVRRYWEGRDAGVSPEQAIRELADGIKTDTRDWIELSMAEFAQPSDPDGEVVDPRRVKQHRIIEATRKHRRTISPVNHRDEWSRLNVVIGRLYAFPLPDLQPTHPAARPQVSDGLALSRLASASVNAATGMAAEMPKPEELTTEMAEHMAH